MRTMERESEFFVIDSLYLSKWDTRMHRLVELCSDFYFDKKVLPSSRKHFLSNFRVRRDKRVQTLSIKVKRGEETLITYNLDWLKDAKMENGGLNHSKQVDDICESIDTEHTRKKRR